MEKQPRTPPRSSEPEPERSPAITARERPSEPYRAAPEPEPDRAPRGQTVPRLF